MVCLLIRLNKKNLSLIDNLQYYKNTHGAINYFGCVLTENHGVLSLPVILLKTFDHSSGGGGVAPSNSFLCIWILRAKLILSSRMLLSC